MRHFSSICKPTIVTYNINDEYFVDVSEVLVKAQLEMSKVLEVSCEDLKKVFECCIKDGYYHSAGISMTPNELQQIGEFASFVLALLRQEGKGVFSDATSATFIAANLNTGKVFTWFHLVA